MRFDKDIHRLQRLHEEYEKQKSRVVALLQFNIKNVGLNIVSEHLGVKPPYLSKLANKKSVSHEQVMKIYKVLSEIQEIVEPNEKI